MGTRVTSRREQADVLADANATQTMESGKTPLACINKAPANFRQAFLAAHAHQDRCCGRKHCMKSALFLRRP